MFKGKEKMKGVKNLEIKNGVDNVNVERRGAEIGLLEKYLSKSNIIIRGNGIYSVNKNISLSDECEKIPKENLKHGIRDQSGKEDNTNNRDTDIEEEEEEIPEKDNHGKNEKGRSIEESILVIESNKDMKCPEDEKPNLFIYKQFSKEKKLLKERPEGLMSFERITKGIIIEPALAIYMAVFSVLVPITSQYILSEMEKRYNLNQSHLEVLALHKNSSNFLLEQAAQSACAQFTLRYSLIRVTLGTPVTLFLGSYSDRNGRRPVLLLPAAGLLACCLVFIFQIGANLPLGVTFIGFFLQGVSGGYSTLCMACFAYLSDTVSAEKLSFRVVMMEVGCNVLQGILQVVTGYTISELGFLWSYTVLASLASFNLFYIVFLVPESRLEIPAGNKVSSCMIHMTGSIKTFVRGRPKPHSRCLLLFYVTIYILLGLPLASQYEIENLYLLNSPISMDSVYLGYWKTLRLGIQCIGAALMAKFFLPKIGDRGVLITGCLSLLVYFALLGFCTRIWMAFTVLVSSVGVSMILPMARAIISKQVSPDEQGGVSSVLYLLDSVLYMIGGIIFNNVYTATLNIFKGTSFLCFAGITGVGIVINLALTFCKQIPK